MPVGIFDVAVRVALVVPTAFLFLVIFQAYLRLKNRKMLLMSIGFGVFFAHALLSIPELFNESYHILLDENAHLFINLIALIIILLGTLKD